MKVVIDGRTATPHFPGIGRYVTNLVRSMVQGDPDMSVSIIKDTSGSEPHPGIKSIPCGLSPFSLRQQWAVPRLLKRDGAALYHSPYYLMPYRLPTPAVLTCYDVIPLIFPEYFSFRQRIIYKIANRLAIKTASRIIAISETTRRDAIRFFGVEEDRILSIPLGVEDRFSPCPGPAVEAIRAKYRLPDQYVLYVGMNKPHKNLVRLVEAWGAVERKTKPGHTLVIAGYWDARYPEARQLAEKMGLSECVHFAGPIDDADLPALYTGAALFVFPSLYEGFGLPVLEAMACGTPVACGAADALAEVAGDAATLFDPSDSTAMADCLNSLLSDPDRLQAFREAGMSRAGMFTWQKTAAATRDAYHSIA